jgi:Cu-Zn family superoxide dismutase
MRAGWLAVAVCGLAVAGVAAEKPFVEKVPIKNAAGEDVGMATFTQVKTGVKVKIELKNLPIGPHGVHIHQNPTCEGPDFKTAGGHFNPDGKQHGFENPMGHHAGDTPVNVVVQENHRGEATFVLTAVTLEKDKPNSLFANGGTSIVVHEKADDMKTDPSGNSGNRIACGVIP